jgi:hypothetical protein
LEAYIQCPLSGLVRHFHVLSGDKGMILRSQARTYHAKQLAQQAIMEVTAVPVAGNEIEVS